MKPVSNEQRDHNSGCLQVVLVSPTKPPMGGIERFAEDLLASKLAEEYHFHLFRTNIPTELRPRHSTVKFTWNILKRDGVMGAARSMVFVFKQFRELGRLLRTKRFTVMHVLSTGGYGFFRNAVHILIARRQGVRTVFHLLGQIDLLYMNAGPWLKRVIRYCLDLADIHIVQSPGLSDFVRPLTRRSVVSIVNGVHAHLFHQPEGFAHGDHGVQVVILGTLGFKKGTFDLLEAAARIKPTVPGLRFVFMGGGQVDFFKGLAEEKGVSDTVRFLGPVDDQVRIEVLKKSDIFALPSHAEGQPIAILEAMASGLPIVSTTVGAIPEVVREANGFVIAPGDVAALVQRLTHLAQNPELRAAMGRHNALEAIEKYSLKRVMKQIGEVYTELNR